MNENYRKNYNDEMEINLMDLMFYLLKRWRSLLVMAVLGLLLGCGVGVLKSERDADVAVEQLEIAPDVLRNMELAYQYRQLYEGQIEYNQNSILMKMNPGEIYTGIMRYYISAGDNTELIGQIYQYMTSEQELIHKIKEETSIDCEEQYIRELLTSTLVPRQNTVMDADGTQQSIVVTYYFVYRDADLCEKVLDIIREENEILREECLEKYGEYVQETVFDGIQMGADNSRLDRQKGNTDVMSSCLTNLTRLEAAFTNEERAYYASVYLGRDGDKILKEAKEMLEANQPVSTKKSMIQWLLFGIAFGVICWGGYYVVKYLLDKRVKYPEELSNYYGLQLIGRYRPEGREIKGIDKIQEQMLSRDIGSCNSKEYIASTINILDEKSLLLIGDRKDQEVNALMNGLGEICMKVECGNLMQNDSETLERAKERAGVVLCVRRGESTHIGIQRELEICRLHNIHVAGAVVVE